MKRLLQISILSSLFLSPFIFAQAPKWQIVPDDSTITFIGTQNDAPVKGEFKKFDGQINFDQNNLKESHVNLAIDMNSVKASFSELGTILKASDWLDSASFPQATFTSTGFSHQDGNHYQVTGQLKIRDKTVPITLTVSVDQNTPNKLLVKGETQIKRTAFGVGQGDWSDTKEIKDDVKVIFDLDLKKAS